MAFNLMSKSGKAKKAVFPGSPATTVKPGTEVQVVEEPPVPVTQVTVTSETIRTEVEDQLRHKPELSKLINTRCGDAVEFVAKHLSDRGLQESDLGTIIETSFDLFERMVEGRLYCSTPESN